MQVVVEIINFENGIDQLSRKRFRFIGWLLCVSVFARGKAIEGISVHISHSYTINKTNASDKMKLRTLRSPVAALSILLCHHLDLSQGAPPLRKSISGEEPGEDLTGMKVNELAENKILHPEIYRNDERPEIYPNDEVDIFDSWRPQTDKPKPDPCCEVHPGFASPANTEYPGCRNEVGQEEITRLKFAVRYLRSAVGSKPFEKCIRHAVDRKYFLTKTSDEHDWVGPYEPCSGPTKYDPCFIRNWPNPEYLAYDVIMNTGRFGGTTSKRKVSLECRSDGNAGSTMETSVGWDYDTAKWGIEKTHEIIVNRNRVLGDYPNHAEGEEYWSDIFGVVGNDDGCNNLGHSYPVDEIAGIIFHEMLHVSTIQSTGFFFVLC